MINDEEITRRAVGHMGVEDMSDLLYDVMEPGTWSYVFIRIVDEYGNYAGMFTWIEEIELI